MEAVAIFPEISSFSGKYRFLSNFYPAPVILDREVYATVEHAYQAAKTLDLAERVIIREQGTPGRAKRLGRYLTLRDDWDNVRVGIMAKLLRQKFIIHGSLGRALIETSPAYLIEGNTWGDRFWGAEREDESWVGQNHLGNLLMSLREELSSE